MFVVARIGKPHGLRGEVTVQVHTDAPDERFAVGTEFATEPDRGPLTLRTVRVHQQVYLLGFEGITDRTAAEALRNTRLLLADEEEAEEDDAWREEDLLGLTVVLTDGTVVGEVSALHTREVQDLLEVRRADGRELLVPFVEEIVPEVDDETGRVTIDPPAGLLELGD
ncbi:ribosome maturation factor RimM [Ornithinimicrobium sp. F0845]|uniref:ribosome maturation factor RimM n=1 Tax=Ornithinimicrobium sp. F0845 TaxID=2926412 RepID=UPI001FF62A4C|nr:ribosome maturation factor RimM [Ornithinimicrobium sp. F0845]MCK0111295.1 ribosome maturation factor RimM [Ornithinimicrobium sp. F0845]